MTRLQPVDSFGPLGKRLINRRVVTSSDKRRVQWLGQNQSAIHVGYKKARNFGVDFWNPVDIGDRAVLPDSAIRAGAKRQTDHVDLTAPLIKLETVKPVFRLVPSVELGDEKQVVRRGCIWRREMLGKIDKDRRRLC